ncbi:hypothetical protein OH491_03460 [Termitidicoccus mucosus]|uniref:hypothetical protein n=1 Tax=Termitidicoccus mucosus TaxID=1184151 RepID=UPI0011AB73A1
MWHRVAGRAWPPAAATAQVSPALFRDDVICLFSCLGVFLLTTRCWFSCFSSEAYAVAEAYLVSGVAYAVMGIPDGVVQVFDIHADDVVEIGGAAISFGAESILNAGIEDHDDIF